MKVIIAGSRSFNDYDNLKEFCEKVLVNQNDIEIVSGTADGADKLGERYAKEKGYALTEFPAKWKDLTAKPCFVRYDKNKEAYNVLAGLNRNEEMAKYADALIIFWDGKSTGSKNMIESAMKHKLKIKFYTY
jgi:ABC-type enterochelin transport system substrate-binding protein